MPLINLSVKHGRSLEEARACLEIVVQDLRARFGALVRRVEWSADRNAVKAVGTGFEVEMRVNAHAVHVSGDLPALGGLLASPFAGGLKQIVRHAFQKRLG